MFIFLNTLSSLFSVTIFIFLTSHLLQTTRVDGFSKKQFSNKLFWIEHQRHFSFPKGFMFKLTSSINLPLWKTPDELLSSSMLFELPVVLDLGKLVNGDLQKRQSIYPVQPGYSNTQHLRSKRHIRNTTQDQDSSCTLGQLQKIKILKKLEGILTVVGIDGGPCLLRAICEFQEFGSTKSYGLFGELAQLLFSLKDIEGECQNDFIKAEERGKRFKCSDYRKDCSKSLFTWKTNYLPYFSGVI